jgi:pimeloyl-ACP methyl ester carboxylesterase
MPDTVDHDTVETNQIIAAAVSYRPIEAPAEVAAAYRDQSPAELSTFELTSLDGHRELAVHLDARGTSGTDTIVISIHGSGGTVLSEPVHKLALGVAAGGLSALAINTRGTGAAVNADNLYATTRDIEAATWMARSLGYERIVLHGHSLGSLQVALFAATHWRDDVAGIVLTGVFADLPWKSRYMLIGNEATYGALKNEALEAIGERDFARRLSLGMGWLQGKTMPVSADHFLTYRAEGLSGARTLEWIERIPYPFLLLRDEHDTIIHDFERVWLEAAAAGGISPAATITLLPSAEGGEGHHYVNSGPALITTVTDWIAALAIKPGQES